MFTSGPPELPGLMAASVCRKSSKGPWRADGEDPVAHLQLVRVTERGGRIGTAPLELEHGEVGSPIGAHHLGLVLLAVGRDHLDLAGALDHVRIGEHDAGGIHDHPRAQALLHLLALRDLAEEAAEELLAEELLDGCAAGRPARHRIDVDHGRGHRLGHLGEAPRGHRQRGRDDRPLHPHPRRLRVRRRGEIHGPGAPRPQAGADHHRHQEKEDQRAALERDHR